MKNLAVKDEPILCRALCEVNEFDVALIESILKDNHRSQSLQTFSST